MRLTLAASFLLALKGKMTNLFPFAAGFSAIVIDKRLLTPGATTKDDEDPSAICLNIPGRIWASAPKRHGEQRKRLTVFVDIFISAVSLRCVFHFVINSTSLPHSKEKTQFLVLTSIIEYAFFGPVMPINDIRGWNKQRTSLNTMEIDFLSDNEMLTNSPVLFWC